MGRGDRLGPSSPEADALLDLPLCPEDAREVREASPILQRHRGPHHRAYTLGELLLFLVVSPVHTQCLERRRQ